MTTLVSKLQAIGDAIRAKTGGSALLALDDMPDEIEGISGGGGFDWGQMRTLTDRVAPYFNSTLSTVDLSGIDVSRVNYYGFMFYNMRQLRSIDLSPIAATFTNTFVSMSVMFSNSGLMELDLTPLDLTHVYSMYNMLSGCTSLQTLKTPATFGIGIDEGEEATFPVAMEDENGNTFAAGAPIPNGAHTYTAI